MIKDSILYFLSRLIPATINFFSLLIFTRMLTPEEYGYYAIWFGVASLCNGIFYEWLKASYTRFGIDIKEAEEKILFSSISVVQVAINLLVAMLLLSTSIFSESFSVFNALIIFAVILSLSSVSFQLGVYRNKFQTKKYILASVFKSILIFLSSLLFIFADYGGMSLLIGVVIGNLIVYLPFGIKNRKVLSTIKFAKRQHIKRLISYGLPMSLTLSFTLIIYNTDRIMIGKLLGLEEAGIYSAVSNFAMSSFAMILGSISLATFPNIIRYVNKNKKRMNEKIKETYVLFTIITIPVFCIILILREEIANIVFGNGFSELAAILLPIICLSSIMEGLKTNYFDLPFKIKKKTVIQVIPIAVASIINIPLNYFFIQSFSLNGAAYATIISYFLSLILTYYIGKRSLKLNLFPRKWYYIVFASVIVSLFLIFTEPYQSLFMVIVRAISSVIIYLILLYLFDVLNIRNYVNKKIMELQFKSGIKTQRNLKE